MKKFVLVFLFTAGMLYSQSVLDLNGYWWNRLTRNNKIMFTIGWLTKASTDGIINFYLYNYVNESNEFEKNEKQKITSMLENMYNYNVITDKDGKELNVAEIVDLVDFYYSTRSYDESISSAFLKATKRNVLITGILDEFYNNR